MSEKTVSEWGRLMPMCGADLALVAALEARCTPIPWSEKQFYDCLADGYWAWCLRQTDKLVGVGIIMSAVDDVELLNVFIDPDYQGCGLGRYLVKFLMKASARMGKQRCFLEVRCGNHVAQSLYTSLGFAPIGVRKGYYPSEVTSTECVREDAIVMACTLSKVCES
ncbi:MAG: ribosomal protein S18-alanine N-acetyltransferase [Gammaproteobacteria bacterium]